jgi:hypothetical protein
MTNMFRWSLAVCIALVSAVPAAAQTTSSDDWKISIYPVFAWVPIGIDIDVNVPPVSGGGGSGPEFGGKIVDGRLDGAFFGGLSAAKGKWRIDADGLWAGVGGDRLENPTLRVDVDAIYAHGSIGRTIYTDLYATVGVRRMAMKYEIELAGRQFERKPGLWDPLIGIGWHHERSESVDLHVTFEGGGFGVGSDVDLSSAIRLDWKPTTHFGIAAGYTLLYFKLSHTVGDRTFTAKQTLHGPVVGLGLYF